MLTGELEEFGKGQIDTPAHLTKEMLYISVKHVTYFNRSGNNVFFPVTKSKLPSILKLLPKFPGDS